MQWFRFYNEALDNPKVQKLDGSTFKLWVNLLCVAGRNDGKLPSNPDLAFALRIDEIALESLLDRLLIGGLIEVRKGGQNGSYIAPHDWEERQYKSDTSTPRVKRYRKRSRNVTETAPDTDTDTDKKTSKKAVAFPRPEWADKDVWSDFLDNRKAKKARNNATAYKRFLADIERHRSAQWTPARLLEYATGRGWAAIYAPTDSHKHSMSEGNGSFFDYQKKKMERRNNG